MRIGPNKQPTVEYKWMTAGDMWQHMGHELEVCKYVSAPSTAPQFGMAPPPSAVNIALECLECCEVLMDYDIS